MKHPFLYFLFFLALAAQAQEESPEIKYDVSQLNDGPYVFIEEDQLVEKRIVNGEVLTNRLPLQSYATTYKPEKNRYKRVKHLAVFSDIHGQYDLAVELLRNNGIVDQNLDWNFRKGHLVIVGDIFDRGPKVNEMLWLVYKLEQQAKKAGGQVHFLLGNHEYMILHNNQKYINEKYDATIKLLGKDYGELYGKQTVLGRWLRSKHTILKIGDMTFLHGGLSKKFLSLGYDMDYTNELMRESIDIEKEKLKETDFHENYYGNHGPIWYRGYFRGDLPEQEIDEILDLADSQHIIVGHCSNEEVVQLYHQKIFGVDSSIKKGKYGEVLFIKKGKKFSRGTLSGERIAFESEN